jgi:hypothetical protein
MAQHTQLRIKTGLPIFFCDPHRPWQRRSVPQPSRFVDFWNFHFAMTRWEEESDAT